MEQVPSRIQVFMQLSEPKYTMVKCHGCGDIYMVQEDISGDQIYQIYLEYKETHRPCALLNPGSEAEPEDSEDSEK